MQRECFGGLPVLARCGGRQRVCTLPGVVLVGVAVSVVGPVLFAFLAPSVVVQRELEPVLCYRSPSEVWASVAW